jgi:hypothetical protein
VVFGLRPALHHRVLAARKVAVAITRAGLVRIRLALLAEAEAVAGMEVAVVAVAIMAAEVATVVAGTQPPAARLAEHTAANLN